MIELNPTRYKLPPYKHQVQGIRLLLTHPVYALFWKPRLGKSAAIINTACELFNADVIDTLLLVAPKQVRDVWTEKELGEIKTHDWSGAKTYVHKKHGALFLPHGECCYVAASVEFLRQAGPRSNYPMVDDLLAALSGRRVWFVYDEASTLGDWKSNNTKAMIALRDGDPIKRVSLLDGTPRGNSHLSFYPKFKVLDKSILGCKTFFHYRARYSEVCKVPHKWVTDPVTKERKAVATHVEVVKEKNQEDFAQRTAPFCQFLEQDVLDMPKKVPGILTVALSDKAWGVYTQMRDEMVADLDTGRAAVSHAAIKCMRLAQICAGFLGGVQEFSQQNLAGYFDASLAPAPITTEVHDEPTEMLMGWLKLRLAEEPNFKAVIWSRFVPEIERLRDRLYTWIHKGGPMFGVKYGNANGYNNELHPRNEYEGPFILVCQPQTAQYANNFSKARTSLFLSQDYNRVTRAQAQERVQAHGAGATTSELDVVITGPRGQKTVVHDIINVVREREDAEKRTAADWKRVLLAE
jgi:hypothetical protein